MPDGTEYLAKPAQIQQIMQVTNVATCQSKSLTFSGLSLPELLEGKDVQFIDNGKMPMVDAAPIAVAGVLVKDLAKKEESKKETLSN